MSISDQQKTGPVPRRSNESVLDPNGTEDKSGVITKICTASCAVALFAAGDYFGDMESCIDQCREQVH